MFPRASDYVKAVQHPGQAFTTEDLREARIGTHPHSGQPLYAAGANAVVVKAEVQGRVHALRFFTREDVSSRERYTALNDHFAAHGLADCVAMSRWQDDAIRIDGRTWPMLRMEWVEGRVLDRYVDFLAESGDTRALGGLAERWRELIARMQGAGFAHGDLQHANVLVQPDTTLRLVDLDGAWVTPLDGGPAPRESGHANYNHPDRTWGRWMDTFPGLVVYASLLALSRDPTAWPAFYDDDNLLFGRTDFVPPHRTPAWTRVGAITDARVAATLAQLKACCAPGWAADGTLENLLVGVRPPWWETPTRRTRDSAGTPVDPPPVDLPAPPAIAVPAPRPVPPTPTGLPSPVPQTPVPAPAVTGPVDARLVVQLAMVAGLSVIIGFLAAFVGGRGLDMVTWIVTSAAFAVAGLVIVLRLPANRSRRADPARRR